MRDRTDICVKWEEICCDDWWDKILAIILWSVSAVYCQCVITAIYDQY